MLYGLLILGWVIFIVLFIALVSTVWGLWSLSFLEARQMAAFLFEYNALLPTWIWLLAGALIALLFLLYPVFASHVYMRRTQRRIWKKIQPALREAGEKEFE